MTRRSPSPIVPAFMVVLAFALTPAGCGKSNDAFSSSEPIGKPAPEIEGEDADGVRFKLSDYRGKVVMLDFWGHW